MFTSACVFYLHGSKPLSLPEQHRPSWSLPCFHCSSLQSILHQAARGSFEIETGHVSFPAKSNLLTLGLTGLSPACLFHLILFSPLLCSQCPGHTAASFHSPSASSIPNPFPLWAFCLFLCLDCCFPNLADLLIFIFKFPAQMLLPWRDLPWSPYLKWLASMIFSLFIYFLHRTYHCL